MNEILFFTAMMFILMSMFLKKGSGWAVVWTDLSVSIMIYLVVQL